MKNSNIDLENVDLGLLIKIISDDLEKMVNAELNKIDLTLSQGGVIHFLTDKKNHQATQKEIELFLDIAHPTVTGIISRLEEKGLVKSEITINRRLSKTVTLTQKGLELSKNADQGRIRHEQILSRGLTDSEKEKLIKLLLKIKKSIDEEKK